MVKNFVSLQKLSIYNDNIKSYISQQLNNFIDTIYPVGAIYLSTSPTPPESLFGGTWEQIKDTFLLSAGDTYTAGNTGGEATHQHEYRLGLKTYHGAVVGTDEDMLQSWDYAAGNYKEAERDGNASNPRINTGISASYRFLDSTCYQQKVVGSTKTSTNMPPYLTVYMWKRTA